MPSNPDPIADTRAREPARHDTAREPIIALGIETSCDETAAAVVVRDRDGKGRILSNVVRSQWQDHLQFGGVVPEIAARAHTQCLDELIKLALKEANLSLSDITCVAAAAGPGLIGGLIVGLTTAKAISLSRGLPLIAVNHLEAHALTIGLTDGLAPPYVLLLVSGGHTQLLLVKDVDAYTRIGTTIDDALGEAFDKTAKLLGLPQPGGPSVEQSAKSGDEKRFALPRPMKGRAVAHFSFAGLKTAIRKRAYEHQPLSPQDVSDLCASFQAAVAESVSDRCIRAISIAQDMTENSLSDFVVAGGVAANQKLRESLSVVAATHGLKFHAPPVALCGDNAAMIAWTGAQRFSRGLIDDLQAKARPRWPLDENAPAAIGAGVKA